MKYVEVLKALEYIRSCPLLTREEGIAFLRDLKNSSVPSVNFAGAHGTVVDILRKKFKDAEEFLLQDTPHSDGQGSAEQSPHTDAVETPVLETGHGRVSVEHVLAPTGSAHRAQKPRRQKK